MRIFLLGDFESDNGPGNANKQIKEALSLRYKIKYSNARGKIGRIIEMYEGIKKTDMLVICSQSKINYTAIKLAKKRRKKIIYLMHGYSSYEKKIENPKLSFSELRSVYKYEQFVFGSVDKIICVSERCMGFMKSELPQYAEKFDYIYNIVDVDNIQKICNDVSIGRKKRDVLSIGGGMKRKNILTLVDAISKMDDVINVSVVGKSQLDGAKIREYSNVTWYEHLTHNNLLQLMTESSLYIQNSSFETFCLAVIEALYAGCSILVADSVGCLDLFDALREEDIICDVSNQSEIVAKIQYLLKYPNNERLMNSFKKELISKEWQAIRWQKIIEDTINA